jgi:hypothetical protein
MRNRPLTGDYTLDILYVVIIVSLHTIMDGYSTYLSGEAISVIIMGFMLLVIVLEEMRSFVKECQTIRRTKAFISGDKVFFQTSATSVSDGFLC